MDIVNLPLFGKIDVHVPDFFVIKMKRGYKLISPTTKSGAITSRKGEKAFKVVKNEKNELFLHEHPFPQIHLKDFSKKDRETMEKYFHKPQAPQAPQPPHASPRSTTSSITDKSFNNETDTVLPSGKRKYNVRKSFEEEKADQKKERNSMASEDNRRIARMARIAAKKQQQQGTGVHEIHHHHFHF